MTDGEPKKKFKFQKKHIKIILILIVVIILAVVILTFLRGWFSFSKDKVQLSVSGPVSIASGEEVEFSVHCLNSNRVALKNAKLIIDFPSGAYSIEGDELTQDIASIDRISPKKEEVRNFKIRLVGERGTTKSLTIRLDYNPENINSSFENSIFYKINIGSVLIGLYLTAPQKAINGEEVSYALDYINNSDTDFSNLKLELDYPNGFSFKTADPKPIEGNNIWQLPQLNKGERGTIKISGLLKGIEGENKTLEAFIGEVTNNKFLKYSKASSVTQISSSPLLIDVALNNTAEELHVNANDLLNYKINFKNNTDIALSQLVLKAYFNGQVFDFKSLKLNEKGFFDSLNNVIIWSAAGVPSLALLAPGESGEVSFTLKVKKDFSINDFNDKNFTLSVRAELETLNVPPQFNLERLKIGAILDSKVNSKVVLATKGYYNETTSNIDNFGPIPPRVNQETAYTIHWQITNTSNDLENVRVTAILPEGITWKNVYTTLNKDTIIEYNDRTKQIVWNVGKLPVGTGFLIPAYELVFQIALRPSIIQVGTSPVLIDESSLNGRDTFTGENLESFSPAISADLRDDPSVGFGKGKVVE